MQQYDSFDELEPSVRTDAADWMLTIADNKQLLGLRYAEWCVAAPELEADVAISAIAQYELGHARLLNGQLARIDEDPREENRQASAWRSLPILDRPAVDWPELVAINGLVDNLLTVNMASATAGGLRPLQQRLRKAVSEEHYHSLHAKAWFGRLAEGPDQIAQRLDACVRAIWPQCLAWFGPEQDNALDRLAAAGVLDAGAAELRERFTGIVTELMVAPLTPPADDEVDWSSWNATSRRHGIADFDEESFSMLTGAHARAMGITD